MQDINLQADVYRVPQVTFVNNHKAVFRPAYFGAGSQIICHVTGLT